MNLRRNQITTEELIGRYQQPLYWHIRRMVVSHDDAQDVLQNTFVKIHLHLDKLKNHDAERAWVYRIATNEALQWLCSRHEFLSLDSDDVSVLVNTLVSDPYTDNGDRLTVLFQEAILTLPTIQRTVFNLRYYDELSYDDIAYITGSSVGSSKTSYHIAKEKISHYILEHS